MQAYAKGGTDTPLLEQTIGDNLEATARRFPEREALVVVHQDIRWSYRRFNDEVDRVARGLLARGIASGDRVGIWAPNLAEWVLVQYATAKLGAILVNINPAYRVHELEYVLQQSGCCSIVAARRFKTSDYVAMLQEARPRCPQLRDVILLDEPGVPAEWTRMLEEGERVEPAELTRRMATVKPHDAVNIQYTSGTTGTPKGATLSHRIILNNARFVAQAMRFDEQDRMCIPVPFYHCAGMVIGNLCCTVSGATMVIPAASFDPAATLGAIERERCTATICVPTMHIAMLSHPDFATTDVSSLRTGAIGGAPCPLEVMKRLVSDFHMPEVTII